MCAVVERLCFEVDDDDECEPNNFTHLVLSSVAHLPSVNL